jgi:pre-mRNA-splicing factor 18
VIGDGGAGGGSSSERAAGAKRGAESSAAGAGAGAGAGPGPGPERYTREGSLVHRGKDAQRFMYAFFKGCLHEWEAEVAAREVELAATAVGRQELAVCRQTREHLKPLFKQCRARAVPPDICAALNRMAERLAELDFRGADDAYISVAVGNQPWLIGVSQVGIHERAAREKVYQGKITHVLNDEVQRRYITSVKRLQTWLMAKEKGLRRGEASHPAAM